MMAFDIFDQPPPEGPLSILMVCTGNICRSPLAEALLGTALHDLPVTVRSAGTWAHVGSPMMKQSRRIAEDLGAPRASLHRAKQLTTADLKEADLVLALAREHRREAVEIVPEVSRRAFTLRELARLANALTASSVARLPLPDAGARMRHAVSAVAQMRGAVPPPTDRSEDDVVDPYGKHEQLYEESASQIVPAVDVTARLLRTAGACGRW